MENDILNVMENKVENMVENKEEIKKYICADCGEEFSVDSEDELNYNDCGEIICESCSENYITCEHCGRIVFADDMECVYIDGICYCSEQCAYDAGYVRCADCGEWVSENSACYGEYEDGWYCQCCYMASHSNINCYHNSDYFQMLGEGENAIRFGMELEVNSTSYRPGEGELNEYAGEVRRLLGEVCNDIEWDGSVDYGFEIITNPMTKEYYDKIGKDKIRQVLEYLKTNGFGDDNSLCDGCGVHIHLSKKPILDKEPNYYEICNMILESYDKAYKYYAKRNNIYSGNYLGGNVKYTNGKVNFTLLKNKLEGGTNRYQIINPCNSETFEWRIFKGTVDMDNVDNYIQCAYNTTLSIVNHRWLNKTFKQITGLDYACKNMLDGIIRNMRMERMIQLEGIKFIEAVKDWCKHHEQDYIRTIGDASFLTYNIHTIAFNELVKELCCDTVTDERIHNVCKKLHDLSVVSSNILYNEYSHNVKQIKIKFEEENSLCA